MTPSPHDHEPNRADLHKDPARVSGMFDQVAKNYDRTNTVLSMGNDRMWRAATTRAVAPRRGQRILDLAAGTGAQLRRARHERRATWSRPTSRRA